MYIDQRVIWRDFVVDGEIYLYLICEGVCRDLALVVLCGFTSSGLSMCVVMSSAGGLFLSFEASEDVRGF